MLFIRKVRLENIRCFDEITIDFDFQNGIPPWTTITGDNATGKTTLLRSIALGLCDITSSAGLLREVPWQFVNKDNPDKRATIEIDVFDKSDNVFCIKTIITRIRNNIEKLDREITNITIDKNIKDEDFEWEKVFICGYGAGRGVEGSVDYLRYSIIDAVYSLYRYDQPLQNPELALRRLIQKYTNKLDIDNSTEMLSWFEDLLKPILLLNDIKDKIYLKDDGIWLKSSTWGEVPLSATGDGYKATLTWVLDFLSWASQYGAEIRTGNIKGIVIVDEIEQHLHPKWQRGIISLIKNAFPHVQFITTTHSPIVATNAQKLRETEPKYKLFHLKSSEKQVELTEVEEFLGELDYDQILASEAFDHIYESNSEIDEILREASILVSKSENRTAEENVKFKILLEYLSSMNFPAGMSLLEREEEKIKMNIMRDELQELQNKVKSGIEMMKERKKEKDIRKSKGENQDGNLEVEVE